LRRGCAGRDRLRRGRSRPDARQRRAAETDRSSLDVSLQIDGNLRGSGYTGCNAWSATLYPVKEQHLLMGPVALTKKQCAKDVMAIEMGFLSALLGSPTWDLVNGELVVKGPRGTLHFDRSL
jgi:heat shock protein HslJ